MVTIILIIVLLTRHFITRVVSGDHERVSSLEAAAFCELLKWPDKQINRLYFEDRLPFPMLKQLKKCDFNIYGERSDDAIIIHIRYLFDPNCAPFIGHLG